jgi:putative NADPH-quinone reductase
LEEKYQILQRCVLEFCKEEIKVLKIEIEMSVNVVDQQERKFYFRVMSEIFRE